MGGAWLAAAIVGVLMAPGTARKLGAALASREGITAGAEGRHRRGRASGAAG